MTKTTMGMAWAITIASMVAAGCGDDEGVTDTGAPPADSGMEDAVVDGSVSDGAPDGEIDGGPDGGTPPCEASDLNHLLVVTTAMDFSRAGLGVVDLADLSTRVATDDLPDTDSAPAQAACVGYVLSRGMGDASVLDRADPLEISHTIDVDPTGTTGPYASNPQTVVAAGPEKAYVIQQARNAVTIIDPTAGGAVLGEIDLSPYLAADDADGSVDASDAIVVGDRLYVALGNYWFDSSFAIQFEGSVLAVIDTATDSLVDVDSTAAGTQGIDLAGDNPWRGLQHDPEANVLWVATTGDGFAIDGQIEAVDLTTNTTMGTVVSEADLSAEINGFGVISETRAFVVAGTELVVLDPTIDPIAPEVLSGDIDGMHLHRGTVWAWARSGAAPGLASFDGATGMETTPTAGRLGFGDLPIFDVVAVP